MAQSNVRRSRLKTLDRKRTGALEPELRLYSE